MFENGQHSMQQQLLKIRVATRQEFDLPLEWAAAQGWNPGWHDADCFHAADPDGFLIGWLGDEPIATISVVRYGETFGFLGFYMVKPKYRGKGYGLQIWNAGIDRLARRNIGLDGVLDQQENYRKSGFSLAYRNIRYQGRNSSQLLVDSRVVPLSTIAFDALSAYDRQLFPALRTKFLTCWIKQAQSTALGILNKQNLVGYAVIRACRSGYKIGPLFADSAELAERLFMALQAYVPAGSEIFMDIPEVNASALDLVKRHHMSAIFETARMYTGTLPEIPVNRIFGVTTFELG